MKAIGKLFKFLTKTILWVIVIALIIPVGYFAVRMGQPMDLPEYKGLTYYQFAEWRKQSYDDLAQRYQESHPDKEVKMGMCNGTDNGAAVAQWVQSATYTYAAISPELQKTWRLSENDMKSIPVGATWATFLPHWWKSFETFQLMLLKYSPHQSVVYCRVPDRIPDDYALSVGAQLPGMVQE